MILVDKSGVEHRLESNRDLSIMQLAHLHGLELELEGTCGGCLACATCHVVVDEEWAEKLDPASEDEEDMLDLVPTPEPTSRLGCQIVISEALSGLKAKIGD